MSAGNYIYCYRTVLSSACTVFETGCDKIGSGKPLNIGCLVSIRCFSSSFRSHCTDAPREVRRFDEPSEALYNAMVKFLQSGVAIHLHFSPRILKARRAPVQVSGDPAEFADATGSIHSRGEVEWSVCIPRADQAAPIITSVARSNQAAISVT